MPANDMRGHRKPGRLQLRRAPSTFGERLQDYVDTAETLRCNRAAANRVYDALQQQPRVRWLPLLTAHPEVHTPQMLARLASAAGELVEDQPAEAWEILAVAEALRPLIPPDTVGYNEACLKTGARRAATLATLGRHPEALAELRKARRFLVWGPVSPCDRAELLVERAYVYLLMGNRRRVLAILTLAISIFDDFGLMPPRERALRVLRLATSSGRARHVHFRKLRQASS